MEFLDLVSKRHSARIYEDKPVPEEDIKNCLEAVRLSPSAFNAQRYRFIVTSDKGKITQIAKASECLFIEKAPHILIAIGTEPENKYNQTDVAIAIDHFQLAAAEKNIGTCWVGTLGHRKVEEILEIDESEKIYAVMPFGYDAGKLLEKKRKKFEDLFIVN